MNSPASIKKALRLLKLSPKNFPLEMTMSSGEKFFLRTPDSVQMHRNPQWGIVIFPENSLVETISPKDVIEWRSKKRFIKPLGEAATRALELLKLKRKDFPLELKTSSGDVYYLTHPDSIRMGAKSKSLALFPKDSLIEFVEPKDVVSIKANARVRKVG